ncbi:MAG: SMP-30/gluconolactonase/LRE family protein [Acidobacteriota bacterium]|nr:SMP-30/gluconolactonase/LRE family protein [Acidobacteriota bacterium]
MRLNRLMLAVAFVPLVVSCGTSPPDESAPDAAVARDTDSGRGAIERLDPLFDELVPPEAIVEQLVGGFGFVEGPRWIEYHGLYGGAVLFSDIPGNAIHLWSSDGTVSVLLSPVFDGEGERAGSNGITTDAEGRVVFTEHGNRRVSRIDTGNERTVMVDRHDGRRLNSPNDLVFHSSGALYFTDPPYGLPEQDDDPEKETEENGIYRLAPDGTLTLLASQTRPNGLAFSPDEQVLYVANSDPSSRLWMAYDVGPEGALENARVFVDLTDDPADGLPDGLKVDVRGNLWATGPGGLLVFTSDGGHLGSIRLPERPANLTFGGGDGKTVFITAQSSLYRIRTDVVGAAR